jgi:hypothetical protein
MIECAVCSFFFEPIRYRKGRRAKYCSEACRQKAHRLRRNPEEDRRVKALSNERTRRWRAAHPERATELNRQWQARNREKTRANARHFILTHPDYARNRLLLKYRLNPADYDALLAAQGGLCAICHQPETMRAVRRLAIDHDHQSGLIRGLLCHGCNLGIGRFGDDPNLLEAAARYLRGRPT